MFIVPKDFLKFKTHQAFMRKAESVLLSSFLILTLIFSVLPIETASAAPLLTISPLTWNVVGLDSNNPDVGPNNFPIGARVCNTGSTAATNVTAIFNWDDGLNKYSGNNYINLRSGSYDTLTISSLAAGSAGSPTCYDFYFEVAVTRHPSSGTSYDKTRSYQINVTADGSISLSTPTPREVYVEHLISQNRNATTDVKLNGTSIPANGTMFLQVGNTYTIELDGSTATQGYNQLEDFINFPNTIFQVLSVQSHYSADSSGYVANSSDKLYADACLWDTNPTSLTYRSCIGSDGKIGGTVTTVYTVKIIGGIGTTQTLNTLIYDFSGSSYHYNSDFSSQSRFASITSPLSLTKSFSPVSISSGGTSTLSIAINNSSASAVSGVSLTDPLPSGVTISGSPASPQCSGTISSTSGSITLTNGTIPADGCTIQATVTASTNGTYTNTTGHLFINGVDTAVSATANLTVASTSSGVGLCPTNVTMASWTVPNGVTANPPDLTGGLPTTKSANVSSAVLFANVPANTAINTSVGHSDTTSWSSYGYKTLGQFIEFDIDTTNFTSISINFWVSNPGSGNGPGSIVLAYDKGSGFTDILTISSPVTGFAQHVQSFTALQTNAAGITKFKLTAINANTDNNSSNLLYDDIVFTGNQTGSCPAATKPTIDKAFSPLTIGAGGTSALTFTLHNTNGANLTSATFSDTLPSGMTVVGTPVTPQCGGTISSTANSVTLTGGTIPANGTCTVTLNVTASSAGVYNNTSGFISTAESGTNTGAGGSASSTLTVLAPPVISKTFSPNPIYSSGASTLTFTITNPNANAALSGVAFNDTFPANLVVSTTPATPQCGGTVSSTSGSVSLSGGSIAAGGKCTVSVATTSSTVGSYTNTSGAVSAIISSVTYNGNTASDTLGVQAVHPGISILKQASASAYGPWASTVNVAAGGNVYYRLTIENTGDVPLSPVSATDPTLNISSCVWPSTLPVGSSTVDPTASCVIGPVTAVTGSHPNTATAHGTYSGTVYNSSPSTATYNTTSLTLVKNATESNFAAAGDTLHYSYTLTNTSTTALSLPATITDSNTTVSCPATDTSGDNDAFLEQNENIVCTASYSVTAFDVSVGSVTNTAYGTVNGVVSNTARKTVYRNLPDLVISKSNNTGGYALNGVSFNWILSVANQGPQDAVFADGQTIFTDQLPASGATYGSATPGAFTAITNDGNINCSINGSKLLTCSASGGSVTIGASTGSFAVTIPVAPSSTESLVNASAVVDPDSRVVESNEGNNTGSDAVTVSSLPVATIAVSPASVLEDGSTTLVYTVTLDQAPLTDTTINLTPGGTATSVTDYSGSVTSVLIPAGSKTATVTISPVSDTTVEGDETVIFTIASGTGYTIGTPSSATGTITDNDLPVATIAVSPSSVAEDGATNLIYTVTLDQAPLVSTTVNLSTTGTATNNTDYTGTATSVTIPAGSTSATVTIDPIIDTLVEPDETVILTITSGTGYTIGSPSAATGTITDNDLPVATIAVAPATVAEDGSTDLVYTVTLDQAPLVSTTVNLSTTGTATTGTDYTGSVISVTIPAGSTSATVTIDPTADTTVEGDETVILTITNGTGYTIGSSSSATGTITDNDLPVVTIAVSPATVAEDGSTDLVYTVTLDQAPLVATTVNLSSSGTATSVTDYTGTAASVNIPAGSTSATVTISPVSDTFVEGNETVIFTITSGTGYIIGTPASATGTITDNDIPVATIAVSPASVLEDGSTDLVYTVTLDQAPLTATTVNLGTSGTATSGTDYTGTVANVTIQAGSTSAIVTITPTTDTLVEPDETVILTITSGTGYTIGSPASATGTITNDDVPVATIAVSPASVAEDGSTNLVYTVTLNQAPLASTTVNLTTTGTATSGTDYTGTVTSVTIPAGSTSATVTIDPTVDTQVEPDETVILTITNGTGYTIGTLFSATGTITDDDLFVATIAVSPASVAEDGATNLVYTVTLNQSSLAAITVNLTTTGTATSGTDYTGTTASVTIPAGSTSASVTIVPTADTLLEPDETVILMIASGTGYTIGAPSSATGTLTNDDVPAPTISKAFSPAVVSVGGTSTITFTLTNPNGVALTGGSFTDTLSGMAISGAQSAGGTCVGASSNSFADGDTALSFSGLALPVNGSCTVTVLVKSSIPGVHPNAASGVTTTQTALGDPSPSVDLTVAAALIGVAKQSAAPVKVSAGVYDVTYTILVHNYGPVDLSSIQASDDLSATFPSPTTFTVQSLSSTKFTVNWSSPSQPTDYNGSSNTNLLTGADALVVGAEGTITVVVRVTPSATGPFANTATASGQPPSGNPVSDTSSDGTNPDVTSNCTGTDVCVNNDNDPTNNTKTTSVTFGASIFDPPIGIKTFDPNGLPVLQWKMVWINESAINPLSAQVNDPISTGTTFATGLLSSGYAVPVGAPAGSSNLGISCQPASGAVGTTTTLCYYEGPTATYPLGRIIWAGTLGPDLGHMDEASAANELIITFNVNVASGVTSVKNVAAIDADLNGNSSFSDPGETIAASSASTWTAVAATKKLPKTGFAPNIVTFVPNQPLSLAYSAYSDLKLEIPALKVSTDIIGVPLVDNQWDITWLGANAGYLTGTAFPTWVGNSVITGHVYLSSGLPGPFVNLGKLKWGDQIVVHAFGKRYVYEVRSVLTVSPENTSVLGHKDRAWVTLLTCKEYDKASGTYKLRTAIQAVLVSIAEETSSVHILK